MKDEKPTGKKPKSQSGDGTRNLIAKFALDQTVGAVFNILLFVVVMGLMNGKSVGEVTEAVKKVSFFSLCCHFRSAC